MEEEEVTFQEVVILQACVVGTHVVVVVEVLVVEPYWEVNHVETLFLLLVLFLQMMKAWTLRTVVAHFLRVREGTICDEILRKSHTPRG